MAMSGVVGSVASLWRFPVKSMRGETLEQGYASPAKTPDWIVATKIEANR